MRFTKIVGNDDGKLKSIKVEAFHLNPYLYYALCVLFFPLIALYWVVRSVLYALYWMFLENAERSICFILFFILAALICGVAIQENNKTPEEREREKRRDTYEIYNAVKDNGDETIALLRDITNRLDSIERQLVNLPQSVQGGDCR